MAIENRIWTARAYHTIMSAKRVLAFLLVASLFIVSPILGVIAALLVAFYLRRGNSTVQVRVILYSVGIPFLLWGAALGTVLLLLWGDAAAHEPGGAIAGAGTFFAILLPVVLLGGAVAGLLWAKSPSVGGP